MKSEKAKDSGHALLSYCSFCGKTLDLGLVFLVALPKRETLLFILLIRRKIEAYQLFRRNTAFLRS